MAFLPSSGVPSATPFLVFAMRIAPVLYRAQTGPLRREQRTQEEARSRSRYANLGGMSEVLVYYVGRLRHGVSRRPRASLASPKASPPFPSAFRTEPMNPVGPVKRKGLATNRSFQSVRLPNIRMSLPG